MRDLLVSTSTLLFRQKADVLDICGLIGKNRELISDLRQRLESSEAHVQELETQVDIGFLIFPICRGAFLL